MRARVAVSAARALWRRPGLWPYAVRLVPPGWWNRWPPVPFPPPEYLRFRLEAMYGEGQRTFENQDLIAYLEWCRRARRLAR